MKGDLFKAKKTGSCVAGNYKKVRDGALQMADDNQELGAPKLCNDGL